MINVEFSYGPYANYTALETKDENTLYFITDRLQIFKGTEEYTKSVKLVSTLPTTGARQGIIYVKADDFSCWIYNGSDYMKITKGYVTAIPDSGASDDTVPTTKAVADYVVNKIQNVFGMSGVFVTDVTYTSNDGQINVAKGSASASHVLTGVAHAPTYDSTTRKITIPVFGSEDLVIELGKDAFVSNGVYNTTTKSIDLTLTNGQTVNIPVGSLIDVFTGIATSSTETIVSSDNKISVKVKVSATANNQVVIEDDGIYVPLPDAYTKAEIDSKLSSINGIINAHIGNTTMHITDAERASWNAKAGQGDLATLKTAVLEAASNDAAEKDTANLEAAKSYTNNLNSLMDGRMTAVEGNLT